MPGAGEEKEYADRLAGVLRELGVPEHAIEGALQRDDPEGAILESVLLPGREERTVTPAEVEARGGLSSDEIADTFQAMGLRRPLADEAALTPEEARVFTELEALGDVWPRDLRLQVARVYGRLLSRIARTGVQLFRLYAEPRLLEQIEDRDEQLLALRQTFKRMLTLPDPLLVGIHRRWLEYELAQVAVSGAEERLTDSGLPGAVDVTLLFCDLKDFTAFANSEGDPAAVDAIDSFAQAVDSERGPEGRIVKALGDGHMLAYDDPVSAVRAGTRIIAAMRDRYQPGVHSSAHRGIVVSREGDYFGRAVNLAARLLGAAGGNELVATGPVAEACQAFGWEPVGVREIRGVEEPVEVFALRWA